jgi:hypothetical protein
MGGWDSVIERNAVSDETARRLVGQLRACQVAALAFCRLLERWGRGEAVPATAGARQAALRRAADRVETALAGLERPLSRYLLELEPERAEGRSWYMGPGPGELVEWRPVLERAGVSACPNRVASAYLELAILVRALESLADAARIGCSPDRSSLWAGLFDLRDTLFDSTVDDLRALAA